MDKVERHSADSNKKDESGFQISRNKAVATASVAWGWAGAVMWGAGAVGGAVYTRASVTCDWAGAVMRKPLAEYRCDGRTNGLMDRLTDRWTDRVNYRVACTRLKIAKKLLKRCNKAKS